MDVNGSVSAEQNHASIVTYLGKDHGDWSIMAHVGALLGRQAEHSKSHKREDDKLHARSIKYKSIMDGQQGIDDVLAKKVYPFMVTKSYIRMPLSTLLIISP